MESVDIMAVVQRTTSGTPGNKLGHDDGVDRISEMPLDILREIFSLLHPTAVLRLAQTCKAFRKYLMNPTLARSSVWIPALKAIDLLPHCPEYISEPRYTYYMFYSRCDDCLSRDAKKIVHLYSTHQMLCQDCIPKHFAIFRDIPGTSDKQIGELINTWTVPSVHLTSHTAFHIASANKIIEEFQAIDPEDSAAINALKGRWQTLTSERNWHRDSCLEFIEYESEMYARLKAKRRKEVIKRMSALGYAAECRTFFSQDDLPPERRAKLSQFDKKLDKYIRDEDHRKLTEFELDQLEAEVLPFMEDERAYRLERRHVALMVERIKESFMPAFLQHIYSQPPNTVLTTAAELAFMPEWVEALLSKPVEEDLSPDDVAGAIAEIPASCEKIRKWKTQQLVEIVRQSKTYEGRDVTEDVLSLASTIFRCSECDQCFTYTTAIVHYCSYAEEFDSDAEIVFEAAVLEPSSDNHTLTRRRAAGRDVLIANAFDTDGDHQSDYWNAIQTTSFDDAAHSHMLNLLGTLGREKTTTAIEMERDQPYVEVLCSCYNKEGSSNKLDTGLQGQRKAMKWLDAINHCGPHSEEEKGDQWYAKLHDQDLAIVAECARKRLNDSDGHGYFPFFWAMGQSLYMYREYYHQKLKSMQHPEGKSATRAYVDSIAPYTLPERGLHRCVVALRALPEGTTESQ